MPLQLPVLDDTDFEKLLEMALDHIDSKLQADWRAASEGDPGRVLIEAFAFLTDQMIYRMNRLPEKVYVAFLRLLGVNLYPPSAAAVKLTFTALPHESPEGATQFLEIPRGTRISSDQAKDDGEAPIFVTVESKTMLVGTAVPDTPDAPLPSVTIEARHCTWVEYELAGYGAGKPGLAVQLAHAPLAAPFHPNFEPKVWVEVDPAQDDFDPDDRTINHHRCRLWTAVSDFSQSRASDTVYTLDRLAGIVQFAPAAQREITLGGKQKMLAAEPQPLADVPGNGRCIYISYAYGGGTAGNVLAESLNLVLDHIQLITQTADSQESNTPQTASYFLTVTNPERASGGREAETLRNGLLRGPQAIYAQDQAVTTRDYERIVKSASDGLARVNAQTKRMKWTYAEPGTVQVLLVPALSSGLAAAAVTPDGQTPGQPLRHVSLKELTRLIQTFDLTAVEAALNRSQALGTSHELKWVGYKEVSVTAAVVIDEQADATSVVKTAVTNRLAQFINPYNNPDTADMTEEDTGWPFGRSLTLESVEKAIAQTPGVTKVANVTLHVAAPNRHIRALTPDWRQPRTWYAGSQNNLYRSTNDGNGWELMWTFSGETVWAIEPNPDNDGLLALVTRVDEPDSPVKARVYISTDCGETVIKVTDFNYGIEDIGWLLRANLTILLLATDQGLYEFNLSHQRQKPPRLDVPSLVPINPNNIKAAIYSLVVLKGQRGQSRVAAALKSRGGVFISDGADLLPDVAPELTLAEITDLMPLAPDWGKLAESPSTALNAELSPDNLPSTPPLPLAARRADSHFRRIVELDGEDVRHLAAQQEDPHSYLWAGLMAEGKVAKGCYCWQLGQPSGKLMSPESWRGGSCRALTFDGGWVYAATEWNGVVKLNLRQEGARWVASTALDPIVFDPFMRSLDDQRPDYAPNFVESPTGEAEPVAQQIFRPYEPLWTIAASGKVLMTGGNHGILRRTSVSDGAGKTGAARFTDTYSESSKVTGMDKITIPYDWLFVSGIHTVDEAEPGDE